MGFPGKLSAKESTCQCRRYRFDPWVKIITWRRKWQCTPVFLPGNPMDRELEHKESWALRNWCFWTAVLEKTLESPLDGKEIKPVNHNGNQSWIFTGRTNAEAGDQRGWDGWMASPTQWTWVWAGSGSWWWTGKPGVLQSMGSQRVRHDWVTELNWLQKSSFCVTHYPLLIWWYRQNHWLLWGQI